MTIPLKKSRVLIGMSGGVDSSVAAYLLKAAGHAVQGVFMQNWESDNSAACPMAQDLADAEAVCEKLKIPLKLVNFAEEYWQYVFTDFLSHMRSGRTPNPDILCNKEIKFKALLNYAKHQGAEYLATGHYARIHPQAHTCQLWKGVDSNKDQSYFLYTLNQGQLQASLFPLGNLVKPQVRALAQDLGLPNHAKKDSTGICFIGKRAFRPFLKDYLPTTPGPIETPTGEIVGTHEGLSFYTIGQRQGLNIGGQKGCTEAPWYVAAKVLSRNALIAVQGQKHPALWQSQLIAEEVHWIAPPDSFSQALQAKIRYRQKEQECVLHPLDAERFQVTFSLPQWAVTPGQAIVFYQGDICLGGGTIALP